MVSSTTQMICVHACRVTHVITIIRPPLNCIFWPIRTLDWLLTASKQHNNRALTSTIPFAILCYCNLCKYSHLIKKQNIFRTSKDFILGGTG